MSFPRAGLATGSRCMIVPETPQSRLPQSSPQTTLTLDDTRRRPAKQTPGLSRTKTGTAAGVKLDDMPEQRATGQR